MADLAAASMTRHRCTHPGCAKVFVTQHFLDKHRNARHTVGQATANSDHAAATTAATAAAPNADTEYHMQDDVAPASSAASGASAHSAAASSSAAAAATSTDLNCPTCFCVYTAPVSLSCPHAMCLECCRRWAATSSEMEAASIDSTLTMLGVTDRDFYAIHGGKPVEGRGVETKQLGVPRHMDRVTDWAARCHVCMGVAKPHQDLVVCDSCKLSVHEACYDITNLSDDSDAEWFCDPCKDARAHGGTMAHPDAPRDVKQRHVDAANAKVIANSRKGAGAAAAASSSSSSAAAASSSAAVARSQKKSAAPSRNQSGKKPSSARCCVCSNALDRALYPVQGGGWIHVSCAAFLDGPVSCGHDDDNLVRGVDDIGPQWFRQQCSFCDEPGATVQCKYGTCVKTYHVPCGIRYGSLFASKLVKGDSGRSCDNVSYRDSVCPLHRKHMESVANQHDPRIMAAQRKAKRQKAARKRGKQTAMPCPVCRKVTDLSLSRANLGLRPAVELQARADAYRLAHPEEEDDLDELIGKYRNSRPHDSSSDTDEDAAQETNPISASSHAAAASSSAAAAAAAAAAPVRSRSGASITSRSSTPRSPRRSLSAAAAAAAAPRSPSRVRTVRTPVESLLSPSPLPSTSSRSSRAARQRTASPPSAPLTPSKRKTTAATTLDVAAAATAAVAAGAPTSLAPRRRPSSVLAASSSLSDMCDADDDADEEMDELRQIADASSSSSSSASAAAPVMPPRML